MFPSTLQFNVTELRLRKSIPYLAAAMLLVWLSLLLPWQVILLIPGILFLGLGQAVWSAMRYSFYRNSGGRVASRERLLDILPERTEAGCPLAANLHIYRLISPFFWIIYGGVGTVVLLQSLN